MRLDPWDDAQALARRISQPGARLVVVVGAAAWCAKCRDHLPVFDHEASRAPGNETHVWLDLEDHAAFLGPFLPPDLPLRLVYESGQLVRSTVPRGSGDGEARPIADPGLHARLCAPDWAD